jgi:hypothetical protein
MPNHVHPSESFEKKHGHVIPRADGRLCRCGGPNFCKVCLAELASLGITFEEWANANRVGMARVLSTLLAVCNHRLDDDEKKVVLAEILGGSHHA